MRTVGEILKQARIQQNLEIKRVAQATKIRPVYLKALEKDDFQSLPGPAIVRGFIKNYAEFLGLSSKDVLAVFRRDFDERKANKINLDSEETLGKTKLFWSPKQTSWLVLTVLILLFILYLVWQYFSLVNAPYY